MNRTLIIARRELLMRLRQWPFWLLTLLMPLVAAGGLYICLLTAQAGNLSDTTATLSNLNTALQDPLVRRIITSVLSVVVSIAYGYTLLSNLLQDRLNGMEELLLRRTYRWEYFLGKTMGVLCIVLTQWLLWTVIGWPLQQAGLLLRILPFILLGYVVNAVIAVLTSRSTAHARQLMGLVIILELLPLECNLLILQHPTGLLAHILTYFPLTTAGTLPLIL